MSSDRDYLSMAEAFIAEAPQYKDGTEYVVDYIQLGIAQQLRRIADQLESNRNADDERRSWS